MDQTMLLSLLAARRGIELPTMPDGSIDPAALDSATLIQRLGQGNPQLLPFLQMMASQKANAAAPDPVIVDSTAVEVDTVADELAGLTGQLEAAHSELKLLRDRCDTMAAALGACALCWGHEPNCRACRGHGLPGRSLPDESLFIEYVMPAVRLLGASRQRPKDVAAFAPTTHGAPRTDATPTHVNN